MTIEIKSKVYEFETYVNLCYLLDIVFNER